MKALIIEDEFTSRKLLEAILKPYAECHLAASATEALHSFHQAEIDKSRYDLICLDIMMPDVHGLSALSAIREHERGTGIDEDGSVKVIVTTVLGDSETVARAFQIGCDAYIVKPIEKEVLLDKVNTLGLLQDG